MCFQIVTSHYSETFSTGYYLVSSHYFSTVHTFHTSLQFKSLIYHDRNRVISTIYNLGLRPLHPHRYEGPLYFLTKRLIIIPLAVKICTTIFTKCINRSGFPNKAHSTLILEGVNIYNPKKKKKCLSNVMDASQPLVKRKIYINI